MLKSYTASPFEVANAMAFRWGLTSNDQMTPGRVAPLFGSDDGSGMDVAVASAEGVKIG